MASLPGPSTSKRPRLTLKIQTTHLPATAAAKPPTASSYPETPLTATPLTATLPSPCRHAAAVVSSTMATTSSTAPTAGTVTTTPATTTTPPLSAETDETPCAANVFSFSSSHLSRRRSSSAQAAAESTTRCPLPYTHPRSLHSILRNSPLPLQPDSPTSCRPQHSSPPARKRVGYDSPLTQEITTNTYTKSHIDLLADEDFSSPTSPRSTADETPDGDRSPGPLDSLRRATGSRKRKRLAEKRRVWVWTIGQDGPDDSDDDDNASSRYAAPRPQIHQLESIGPGLAATTNGAAASSTSP